MVPERLGVTAIFGEVVLDLREAVLQSQRVTLLTTVVGGTVQLFVVPDGVAVEVTGSGALSRRSQNETTRAAPDTPVMK